MPSLIPLDSSTSRLLTSPGVDVAAAQGEGVEQVDEVENAEEKGAWNATGNVVGTEEEKEAVNAMEIAVETAAALVVADVAETACHAAHPVVDVAEDTATTRPSPSTTRRNSPP